MLPNPMGGAPPEERLDLFSAFRRQSANPMQVESQEGFSRRLILRLGIVLRQVYIADALQAGLVLGVDHAFGWVAAAKAWNRVEPCAVRILRACSIGASAHRVACRFHRSHHTIEGSIERATECRHRPWDVILLPHPGMERIRKCEERLTGIAVLPDDVKFIESGVERADEIADVCQLISEDVMHTNRVLVRRCRSGRPSIGIKGCARFLDQEGGKAQRLAESRSLLIALLKLRCRQQLT